MRYFRIGQETYAYEPAIGTPSSDDYDPRQQALIDAAIESGWEELHHWPPPPTPEEITARLEFGVQRRLDDFARTRGYSDILSACSYATSTIDKFRTEGQYCVEARDATWSAAYDILASEREIPTSITDIEDKLPALTWPT
jgi:hypothetical protein